MTILLIYRSAARHPFPHSSDLDILRTAWATNRRLGITGYLVRTASEFFQVLEGPREKVRELFEHIRTDERHEDVRLLGEIEIDERRFPNWAMGYAEDIENDPNAALFTQAHSDTAAPEAMIAAMQVLAERRGGRMGRAAAL